MAATGGLQPRKELLQVCNSATSVLYNRYSCYARRSGVIHPDRRRAISFLHGAKVATAMLQARYIVATGQAIASP